MSHRSPAGVARRLSQALSAFREAMSQPPGNNVSIEVNELLEAAQAAVPCIHAPADELTVDDVLGMFGETIATGWTFRRFEVRREGSAWYAIDRADYGFIFDGTLREVLTEAKRRGLLG